MCDTLSLAVDAAKNRSMDNRYGKEHWGQRYMADGRRASYAAAMLAIGARMIVKKVMPEMMILAACVKGAHRAMNKELTPLGRDSDGSCTRASGERAVPRLLETDGSRARARASARSALSEFLRDASVGVALVGARHAPDPPGHVVR